MRPNGSIRPHSIPYCQIVHDFSTPVEFLLQPGPIAEQAKAVRQILERIQAGEASEEVTDWLLPRMTKTIESYAKLHGPSLEAPLLGGSKAWGASYRI